MTVQAEFFRVVWGPIGATIFLIVVLLAFGDTYLVLLDSVSRINADVIFVNIESARKKSQRWWYYLWVAILVAIAVITIPLAAPGWLIIMAGMLSFVTMTIYCPFLIYLSWFLLPKAHHTKYIEPGKVSKVFMAISTAFYWYLTVWWISVSL